MKHKALNREKFTEAMKNQKNPREKMLDSSYSATSDL